MERKSSAEEQGGETTGGQRSTARLHSRKQREESGNGLSAPGKVIRGERIREGSENVKRTSL